jgi:hypothetical protein
MLDDQIVDMKMEVKLGQLFKIAPIAKNISKIFLKNVQETCPKCVQNWYTPQK